MIKSIAIVALIAVVSGLTFSGAMGVMYGTVDTLQTATETVSNFLVPDEFRGNAYNEYGSDSDPYGLGITDINADEEVRPVWFEYERILNPVDIEVNGEAELLQVNPYIVSFKYRGEWYDAVQGIIRVHYFDAIPVTYSIVWIMDDNNYEDYYYVSALGINNYKRVTRDRNLLEALNDIIESNAFWGTLENDASPTSLLRYWEQTLYD